MYSHFATAPNSIPSDHNYRCILSQDSIICTSIPSVPETLKLHTADGLENFVRILTNHMRLEIYGDVWFNLWPIRTHKSEFLSDSTCGISAHTSLNSYRSELNFVTIYTICNMGSYDFYQMLLGLSMSSTIICDRRFMVMSDSTCGLSAHASLN